MERKLDVQLEDLIFWRGISGSGVSLHRHNFVVSASEWQRPALTSHTISPLSSTNIVRYWKSQLNLFETPLFLLVRIQSRSQACLGQVRWRADWVLRLSLMANRG
jgi:hypothetical protein